MKRKTVVQGVGVTALSLACLLVLHGMITSPILYSEDRPLSTLAHARPSPDERPHDGRVETVVPTMEDLMDRTETIVLHVREKDFEKAEEDLARYIEASRTFNTLIVSLDMTESDVREFAEGNMEHLAALTALLEKSKRMDELSRLEVVYQDEEDPGYSSSISYEGEALQMKMEEAMERYQDQQTTMTEVGTKYDLPVASYIHSATVFAGVVNETDHARQAWTPGPGDNRPDPPAPAVSVDPPSATYGETIQVSGTTLVVSSRAVSLFLDGTEWTTATADQAGGYVAAVQASSLGAGRHLVYAVHDGVYSDPTEFEVVAAPAALTLEAGPLPSGGEENVACRGTLFCQGRPVDGAQVTVTSDDGASLTAETNRAGAYSCTGHLAPGQRALRAEVSEDLLPIRPTVSESVEVAVPEPGARVTVPVMQAAAVLLMGIGASAVARHWRALRRARHLCVVPGRKVTPAGGWPGRPPDGGGGTRSAAWTPGAVDAQYAVFIAAGRYSDAVRLLYLALAARIGTALGVGNYTALTPREVLGIAAAGAPPALSGFIHGYEKVRYGRHEPSYEQTEHLRRLYTRASGTGGDDD
ncbi:hypothetical protein J2129_000506 [Methanofollis sp. W23]|uniref:carboxypeptidase-like regulatory domain-containing protein n=1 Tax=Methanofollis sp. W23 TaxID=2817849 RepID=UPI001AE7BF55|nr:carboxypeptidase-like regulatory domain-containing protein [Methanofollis sp. W23]MBP2145052.1 hypothetical protein [Methanofollis sp. W23]